MIGIATFMCMPVHMFWVAIQSLCGEFSEFTIIFFSFLPDRCERITLQCISLAWLSEIETISNSWAHWVQTQLNIYSTIYVQLGESRESYRNCIENNLTFDNYLNFIILVRITHRTQWPTADIFNRIAFQTVCWQFLCLCLLCSWPCYKRHSIRVAQVASSSFTSRQNK